MKKQYDVVIIGAGVVGSRVHLAAGTLYGALTSLCEKGWIRKK